MPVAMPDLHDFEAVAAWRHAINTHWGEDDDPDVAHAPCVVGGVPCLRAGSVDSPTVVYVHGGGYCLGHYGCQDKDHTAQSKRVGVGWC